MKKVLQKLADDLWKNFNIGSEYATGYSDCLKEICQEFNIPYEEQEGVIKTVGASKRKLELTVEAYKCLCALETFVINGIEADQDDFGEQEDQHPQDAEPYCCADMQFVSKPATDKVLQKYGITLEDYNTICEELEDKLSFGCCGWCS